MGRAIDWVSKESIANGQMCNKLQTILFIATWRSYIGFIRTVINIEYCLLNSSCRDKTVDKSCAPRCPSDENWQEKFGNYVWKGAKKDLLI